MFYVILLSIIIFLCNSTKMALQSYKKTTKIRYIMFAILDDFI